MSTALTGSMTPYWDLLTVDPAVMDPSDVLNLVDEARKQVPFVDEFDAERIEARCLSVELDVHLTYTPAALALVCCE